MEEAALGQYAKASDYDALAAELAAAKEQNQRWADAHNEMTTEVELRARVKALEAAVREAKEIVKAFHDMGSPKHMREEMWDLYQQSPEMKRLNAALTPQEIPIAQSKSQQKRFEAQGVAHVPFAEETACEHDWQGVAPGPERCSKCGTSRSYWKETAVKPTIKERTEHHPRCHTVQYGSDDRQCDCGFTTDRGVAK